MYGDASAHHQPCARFVCYTNTFKTQEQYAEDFSGFTIRRGEFETMYKCGNISIVHARQLHGKIVIWQDRDEDCGEKGQTEGKNHLISG